MSNEIAKCPFCGTVPLLQEFPAYEHVIATFMPDHDGSWAIECPGCGVGICTDTKENALAVWNKRVNPVAPDDVIAARPEPQGWMREAANGISAAQAEESSCTALPLSVDKLESIIASHAPKAVPGWINTPDAQGLWWYWNGHPDDAPYACTVLWSGTESKYFVCIKDIDSAPFCDTLPGKWLHIPQAAPPEGRGDGK